MKVHILTNALDYGDAVSNHSGLLKECCKRLGVCATLYAHSHDPRVPHDVVSPDHLVENSDADDILLHQFFNASHSVDCVERFPGRRVMMYHNITPPEYFLQDSPVRRSCTRGLRQAADLRWLYDLSVGMTEFSRRSLEQMGYSKTGVFPLLLDLEALTACRPDAVHLAQPKPAATVFLFVGRVAPNKRLEDLIRILAEYRKLDPDSALVLVGNEKDHPGYRRSLSVLVRSLGLKEGQDVIFTGKVPLSHLVSHFRQADAFLCMSEHEGFCAPLLESMAFGLPTFAYASEACEETMGGAGILIRNKDFRRTAEEAFEVLHDPERRLSIVGAQFQRLHDFEPAKQLARVQQLLATVANLPGRASYRPTVSVIINTYNRAWWLSRCLNTLTRQAYRNFEVVVINGPSTDHTESVLAQHGSRIKAGSTPHRVISVSRNEGIARASGELVAFLDDDAVPADDWLENLVPAFQDPKTGGVGGTVLRMNGTRIEFRNGILDRHGFVKWDEPFPGLHYDWEEGYLNTVAGGNCAFRREYLREIGGFDERIEYYHDEADIAMRLASRGWRVEHRPRAIIYHDAAPSENRTLGHSLNWYAIVRNTVYVALKNYSGSGSRWALAFGSARRVTVERGKTLCLWRREGKLSNLEFLRTLAWAGLGIAVGVMRGIRGRPRLRSFAETAESEFLKCEPRKGGISVCLLSQALPDSSPGGIPTYTMSLARGLRDLGCVVHIVSRSGPLRATLREGIWLHRAEPIPLKASIPTLDELPVLKKNLELSNGILRKVQDIDARWTLDLVESPNWDFEGLLTAMEHRKPCVVRAHSPMFEVIKAQNWPSTRDLESCVAAEGLLFRHASAVTGSTRAILNLVGQRYDLTDKPTGLVPLGLDVHSPAAPPAASKKPTVLFVGRLERRKGIHVLLSAIPKVLNRAPDTDFLIVGKDGDAGDGGTWRQWFWAQHDQDPKLRSRVRFLGEVSNDELVKLYASCDVFIAPSLYESFGLVYLEAMSQGKPVVGCKAGGVPEVVVDGETGILVPPDDAEAVETALIQLLADADRRKEMGRAGKARVEEHFSVASMAKNTLDYYKQVVTRWQDETEIRWVAGAMDLRRTSSTRIVWVPELNGTFLLCEDTVETTFVFGPYIGLPAGGQRAQFSLWIGTPPSPREWLLKVDVYNGGLGELQAERKLWPEDFSSGPGRVIDVFFDVPPGAPEEYEFRICSAGRVPIYVNRICVTGWPSRSALRACSRTAIGDSGTPDTTSQPEMRHS
jgi:glycosyltransferase involved in cell wall biosynthesis/GT2 family glycosyltransferase